MIINRAIVSTDNNPIYYGFWPLTAKGWRNIGFEPTVAVIGDLNIDHSLGTIVKVPLIDGIPSGFIAQTIRFIIPCLFPEEVSVIGDIDMIPLNKDYFTKKISQYDNDDIVIFSADAYKTELRYPMCYIAAKGKYFQEIIGIADLNPATITAFIKKLYALDKHWDTDELFFAEQLHRSTLLKKVIFLTRGWNPYAKHRIDRVNWKYSKSGLYFNKYIDVHCLRPVNEHINKLKNVTEYLDHGSDGKKYFYYVQKKPVRKLVNFLKLIKQNHLDKDFYSVAHKKNLDSSKNKIVSFSLYGDNPRYTGNIEKIIDSYQKLLPDWKCRIYVAKDVNPKYVNILIDKECEVFIMKKSGIDARYTNWRFLAINDGEIDAVIIRDLDSLAYNREKIMIEQWLASGKKFHIIRDHINHNSSMMAGMWGTRKNNINIKIETKKHLMTDHYGVDQGFLNQLIYPLIKNDVMVHDSFPRFPHEDPIIIPFKSEEGFIGEIYDDRMSVQNDQKSHRIILQ